MCRSFGEGSFSLFALRVSVLPIVLEPTGKLRMMICDMDEMKGKNAVTGADSRDSIFCTEISYIS